jgi:hypothetical protein
LFVERPSMQKPPLDPDVADTAPSGAGEHLGHAAETDDLQLKIGRAGLHLRTSTRPTGRSALPQRTDIVSSTSRKVPGAVIRSRPAAARQFRQAGRDAISEKKTDQTAGKPSVLQRRRTYEFFLGSTCLVQESLNSREELEPILLHGNRVRAFRKHDVSLIGSVHKQRKQCLRQGRQISIPFCLHRWRTRPDCQ